VIKNVLFAYFVLLCCITLVRGIHREALRERYASAPQSYTDDSRFIDSPRMLVAATRALSWRSGRVCSSIVPCLLAAHVCATRLRAREWY